MFWSLFFICLGIMLLIQQVFHVDLPMMKLFFGIFLVYMGLKIIFGAFGIEISRGKIHKVVTDTEIVFSEGSFKLGSAEKINRKFSTVFGKSNLNLEDLSNLSAMDEIKIENVFSKTSIKTNPSDEIKVISNCLFGNVKVRGQKLGSLGELEYRTPGFDAAARKITIKLDALFGEVEIN